MAAESDFQPALSEGKEATPATRDSVQWWHNGDIKGNLQPVARELLENYSKIPADEVEDHVYAIREKAWAIHPYPCIGLFRFLDLSMTTSPHYPTILSRLKTGKETLLDLGCCFGQELRKLVYDGVPSAQLYGCDLRSDYFDCGFDLFRDRETFKGTLFQADIFDPESDLKQLDGKMDIIYVGSFLHLFAYSQQVEVCVRISELLRDQEGVMVVGRQVGSKEPGEYPSRTREGEQMMKHDVESFRRMWDEVGRLTGTKWRVDGDLKLRSEIGGVGGPGPSQSPMILRFAVFREALDVPE